MYIVRKHLYIASRVQMVRALLEEEVVVLKVL